MKSKIETKKIKAFLEVIPKMGTKSRHAAIEIVQQDLPGSNLTVAESKLIADALGMEYVVKKVTQGGKKRGYWV